MLMFHLTTFLKQKRNEKRDIQTKGNGDFVFLLQKEFL